MRISLNWLKDYVKLTQSTSLLIATLDNIGLLVDEWEEKDGDVILELETYANRPDTTGHMGVARELAAALGVPLEKLSWPLTEIEEKTSDFIDIQIHDEKLCSRYSGIIVKGVKVGPSPNWLRKKIESMGLNPVNNVVDVTNYVLFSTAHPIHAFDLDKLEGKKIIVRQAVKGEIFRSLESKDINLSAGMLVIADDKKPVALAGVMGGEETAVSADTQNVFIESACFDPVSVRKTSKSTGIQTDASYRFERGADVSFPPQAALMAASLLSQMGGKVTQEVFDVYPKPRKSGKVMLRHHRVNELLGIEVDSDFIVKTLSSLNFQVKMQQKGTWQVKVPDFRVDIDREADLIEEIARFYGYDNIPSHIPPISALEPIGNQLREEINKLRLILFDYGFNEVVNFSFIDPDKEVHFKNDYKAIEIRNPISSKAAHLRPTLLDSLLGNVVWNLNRGAEGVHAFEIGNVYFWEKERSIEQLSLCLVSTGNFGTAHWQSKNEKIDFFHLKGACEALMVHLRFEPFSFLEKAHPYFEEKYSLSLSFKGEEIGFLGLLKKEILDVYSLEDSVWSATINLEALFEKQPRLFHYSPVIKYPSVSRDITFIADLQVPYQEITEAMKKLSLPFLEKMDLYDRFMGKSTPKGKGSLSFRFVFRHPQRTLLAEEVDGMQQKIIDAFKADFNFQLREGGKIDK